MLKEHTSARILSWEEVTLHLKTIASQLPLNTPIKPLSAKALVAASIIAEINNTTIDFNKGITFDITDKDSPKAAIFHLDRDTTYASDPTEIYVDVLYEDQKLFLPWYNL